jgi:hypothetical protein
MSLREQTVKRSRARARTVMARGWGVWLWETRCAGRCVRGKIGRFMGGQRTCSILLRRWHWFGLIICALYFCEADRRT